MKSLQLTRYQLPLFFLLAFAITWAAHIPVFIYAHNNGLLVSNEANFLNLIKLLNGTLDPGFVPYLLLFMFSFGPTVAGILVTGTFKGKTGLRELFSRVIKVNIPLKWLLTILLLPLAIDLGAVAIGYFLSGFRPFQIDFLVPLNLTIPFLLYMIIFTGIAEEVGWRGYALPELLQKFTAEKSSWILGIMWGVWHIPSNLLILYLQGDLTIPVAISVLAGLTFGIVGWTIVLTWIYNNTKSVFWIIILHGWFNLVQSYFILSSSNEPAKFLIGILPWAIAAYLLKKYGAETLTGQTH